MARTGRPRKVSDEELLHYIAGVPESTTADIARYFGIDRSTVYVRLRAIDRVEWITDYASRRHLWLLTP